MAGIRSGLNFRRILANAVARRVAYVLVATVLAWLFAGLAKATPGGTHTDQGAAYAACHADMQTYIAARGSVLPSYVFVACHRYGTESRYVGRHNQCSGPNGSGTCTLSEYSFWAWPAAKSCSARPNYVGPPPMSTQAGTPRSGSVGCLDGCTTAYFNNGDGTVTGSPVGDVCGIDFPSTCSANGPGYYWNPFLGICEPPARTCEAGEIKNSQTGECEQGCPAGMVSNSQGQCEPESNECPAGEIKAPSGACLPGEGQCAAGEARRKDGTCGKDSNGDGEADDDDDDPNNDSEKETFSGGDNCQNPPACSGSPVMCGQARIQWRIDCNTRKNRNVSGGSCAAMPVCTGEKCDAVEYSSLLMQWRTACALEKQSGGGSGSGQPDWTKVTGDGSDGVGQDPDGPVKDRTFDPSSRLDAGGFLSGGGSCPQLGTLNLPFGKVFDMDAYPWFCDLLYLTRMFLTMLGSFIALVIIVKGKL